MFVAKYCRTSSHSLAVTHQEWDIDMFAGSVIQLRIACLCGYAKYAVLS